MQAQHISPRARNRSQKFHDINRNRRNALRRGVLLSAFTTDFILLQTQKQERHNA